MFGFNSKIEILEKRINDLEKNIADLRNPYTFNIGDIVYFYYNDVSDATFLGKGVVIERYFEHGCICQGMYYRINTYKIFYKSNIYERPDGKLFKSKPKQSK